MENIVSITYEERDFENHMSILSGIIHNLQIKNIK